jgi:hypothetical protein
MVLALSIRECQHVGGIGAMRYLSRQEGNAAWVPSVAGVGSIRTYATEDWSLWQRR